MSDLPVGIREALSALRRRLEQHFGDRLLHMTLFGSYARGQAHADSDVDVLVVIRGLAPRERGEVYEEGAEVWMDTGHRLAPLACSDEDWARMERQGRLLVSDVARDGIAV